jgi:hypothetical protein
MNIAIINSRRENPRAFWILDFGFWIKETLRIFEIWDFGFEIEDAGKGFRSFRLESKIQNPKSKMLLPVTVLLSIKGLFVGSRADVEDVYLVPVLIVLSLI